MTANSSNTDTVWNDKSVISDSKDVHFLRELWKTGKLFTPGLLHFCYKLVREFYQRCHRGEFMVKVQERINSGSDPNLNSSELLWYHCLAERHLTLRRTGCSQDWAEKHWWDDLKASKILWFGLLCWQAIVFYVRSCFIILILIIFWYSSSG